MKMGRSLVHRVFAICFALLVIPLIVYTLYVAYTETSHHLLWHLVLFLIAVIIFGGVTTTFLVSRMAKPLRQLDEAIQEVEEGNLSARYLPDQLGFEINIIGNHFNRAMDSITELSVAREIQKNLLPKPLPSFSNLEIGSGIHFAKEVGGDLFDLFTRSGKLHITVADASGKGMGACLYSLEVRSMLRSFSFLPLQEALLATNKLFCEDTEDTGTFVTTWAGRYDPQTKIFEYSSCGHPHALLLREEEVKTLSTQGMGLGVSFAAPIQTGQITLQPGDLLLLYTDGIIEARKPDGHMLGKQQLIASLQELSHLPPQKLVDTLLSQISGDEDDITLIAIKVT